jgi:hypothetical protein
MSKFTNKYILLLISYYDMSSYLGLIMVAGIEEIDSLLIRG